MTVSLPIVTAQRSHGAARVALAHDGAQTRLVRLGQSGSAKAFLPAGNGASPEIVFLNTSGGLTGGDTLAYGVSLGPGARATATTQTAERAYRAETGQAQVRVTLDVGADGFVEWLPQETILFQGAAVARTTEILLGPGAGCLALEAVVLGRAAMGESVTRLSFRDRRTIRRDGAPVMIEPLALDAAALAAGPAVLGGARAFASLVLVAGGAEALIGPLRAVLDTPGATAAASAFDGRLVLRIIAGDGLPLRRQILRALAVLRRGPPPRVWQP